MAQVGQQRELWETPLDGAQVLVGVYGDARSAEQTLEALKAAGFDPDEVNVLRGRGEQVRAIVEDTGLGQSQALSEPEAERTQGQVAVTEVSRVNTGMGFGLIIGALAGATAALALQTFPGIGDPLRAWGIWTLVAGALAGAAFGLWGGSLIGMGVPEEDTSYYTGDLDRGAFLVALRTNRIDEAIDLFRSTGARNFQEHELAH